MDALDWLRKQLEAEGSDLLREMVRTFAERLMAAEMDVLCNAGFGEVTPERTNSRNGYRSRQLDTRVGTIDLAIPKVREGSYYPGWLLEPRRRAERALVAVVAECYVRGVSTRRVEGLVQSLGIEHLSKSQVSRMASDLDVEVAAFRGRPLDGGPYTYVSLDAMTQKVREGGRIVNVAVVIAVGVNAEGHREVLGFDIFTSEDGAGWLAFLRGLVARGLAGTHLGDLRRPCRARGRGALHAHRHRLATMPHPFHAQPVDPGAEVGPGDGGHAGAHDLRPARRRVGVGTTRTRRRPAHRPVPGRSRAARRGRTRRVGLHQLPQGALEADLVEQPPGTTEQGTTPPHRCRGHLPQP
jgi:putative transposase